MHPFKLHRSYLISFNLLKASEIFLDESERTVSKFRKGKRKFLSWFTDSMKQSLVISKFHVAVGQPRQRNEQNSMMHEQICCFVNKDLLLFCRSPSVAVVVGFVVIQNSCYHGDVTSHLSSLSRGFHVKVAEHSFGSF